jgi:hypothetical protein
MRNSFVLFGVVPVAILAILFFYAPSMMAWGTLRIAQYTNDVYAVYLDNGAVFYGSIGSVDNTTIRLRNAYTFRAVQVGDTTSNTFEAQEMNSLTRPEGGILVSRDRVLFMERVGARARILEMMEGL